MNQCAAYGCSNSCQPGKSICGNHAKLGMLTNPDAASSGSQNAVEETTPRPENPQIDQSDSKCACSCDDFVNHISGCRINDERSGVPDGCGEGCGGDDTATDDWTIFPEDVIRKVVKEAIHAVYLLHPDIFTKPKEVTLAKGRCVHYLCEECTQVTSVISVDGYDCNELEEEDGEEDSLDFLACLYPEVCKTPTGCGVPKDAYDPGGWRKDEGTPCMIRFKNPTPSDREVKALVSCIDPCVLDCTESLPARVCTEAFTPIIDNALFRLHSRDHKDGNMLEIAQLHWAAYESAMMAKFRVDYSLLRAQFIKTIRKEG